MKTYAIILAIVVGLSLLSMAIAAIFGWDRDTVYGFLASGAVGLLVGEVRDQRAEVRRLRAALHRYVNQVSHTWN